LALISGIVSEADYVFIPESPPPQDWARKLCDKLMQASETQPKTQFIHQFHDKNVALCDKI